MTGSSRVAGIAAGVITSMVAGLVVVAWTTNGYPSTSAEVEDHKVWVTNGGAVGRLSQDTYELDGEVVLPGNEPADILQSGTELLVVDKEQHRLRIVDTANDLIRHDIPLPERASASSGGPDGARVFAVTDQATGKVWVGDVADLDDGDLTAGEPTAITQPNGRVVVGADGTTYVVVPGSDQVTVIDRDGDGGFPTRVQTLPDGPLESVAKVSGSNAVEGGVFGAPVPGVKSIAIEVSTLGNDLVVLDPAARRLVTLSHSFSIPAELGERLRLQMSGPSSSTALVASEAGLFDISLADGKVVNSVPTQTAAQPARPVRVGDCRHGAWAAQEPVYVRVCADGQAFRKVIPAANADSQLVFRVNRKVVVLNDARSGVNWMLDDKLTQVTNWDDLKENSTEREGDGDTGERAANAQAKREQPDCSGEVAAPTPKNDDNRRVRVGRTTEIDVVANDAVAGCAVPLITSVKGFDPAKVDVTIVNDGRSLQVTPKKSANGILQITYELSTDSQLTRTGVASIEVIAADAEAIAPKKIQDPVLNVPVEGRASHNVLSDFYSPTGDAMTLTKASVPADSGVKLSYQPDGWVDVELTGSSGKVDVTLQISDGTNSVTATLTLVPVPQKDAAPLAPGLLVRAATGQQRSFDALVRATDPRGARPELVKVESLSKSVEIDQVESSTGAVTFTAVKAGTTYLRYVVSANGLQTEGRIRVEVTDDAASAPLIPGVDMMYLSADSSGRVNVLDNDTAPDGAALAVSSATPDSRAVAAGVSVTVIDNAQLRVTSKGPIPSGGVWIDYSVTDGNRTAAGKVLVVGVTQPQSAAAPVAANFTRRVTTGGAITVPLNAFASDPRGLPVTVSKLQLTSGDGDHRFFPSAEGINFRAGDTPETVRVTYTVVNSAGKRASAVATFLVVQAADPNQPPHTPPRAVLRTMVGTTGTLSIDIDDLDPDGDPVVVTDATVSGLGTAAVAGPHTVQFTADKEPGNASLTFTVSDGRGGSVEGHADVIVVATPTSVQDPVTPDLTIQLRPGATSELQVLGQIIDPAGLPVTLDGEMEVAGKTGIIDGLAVRPDGSVQFTGVAEGSTVLTYAVRNSRQGRATGKIRVQVSPNAPKPQPRASQIVVSRSQVDQQTGVASLDVTSSVTNVGGLVQTLKLAADPTMPQVSVTGDRTLSVPIQETRQVYTYSVKDSKDGGVAEAFLVVPSRQDLALPEPVKPAQGSTGRDGGKNQQAAASRQAPATASPQSSAAATGAGVASRSASAAATSGGTAVPTTRRSTEQSGAGGRPQTSQGQGPGTQGSQTNAAGPTGSLPATVGSSGAQGPVSPIGTLRVPAGETTTFAVSDYLQRGDGSAVTVSPDTAPSASVGTVRRVDDNTLEWQVPADAAGPARLTLVTGDGERVELPAEIDAAQSAPPTLLDYTLEAEPGTSQQVDAAGLVEASDAAQRERLEVTLGDPAQVPDGVSLSTNGTTLTVALDPTVPPGTSFAVPYTVKDPQLNDEQTGTITVIATDISAERATVDPVAVTVEKGRPQSVELLAGAYNPMPNTTMTVVSIDPSQLPGSATINGDKHSATVSGSEVGEFQVPFTAADGTNDPSRNVDSVLTITVRGAPSAPGKPESVAAGNSAVTLQFDGSQANGSDISGYHVRAEPAPTGDGWTDKGFGCADSPCELTGLTNGTTYTFSVYASNESGDSEASTRSEPILVDAAPGVPNVKATIGDGSLLAAFTAAEAVGTDVAEYQMSISPAAADPVTIKPGDKLEHQFTGLTNGTEYMVTVTAANKSGQKSEPGTATGTPAGKPGPVENVTISSNSDAGNNGEVQVTFDKAFGNGDENLTYLVQWLVNGQPDRTDTIAPGQDLAAVYDKAVLGTKYQSRVTAKNAVATSDPVDSQAVVPQKSPQAMTNLTAAPTGQPGKVDLSWDPIVPDGHVFNSVQYRIGSGAWTNIGVPKEATKATVSAPNGAPGTFAVRYCNSDNTCSQTSNTAKATPYGSPAPPQALTLTPESTAITATWQAPGNTGGVPIKHYEYRINNGPWAATAKTTQRFTGLQNGTNYTIDVRVVNQGADANTAGNHATKQATPYDRPPAPTLTKATSGNGQVRLDWDQPANGSGLPITGFEVKIDNGGFQSLNVGGGARSATVSIPPAANHTFVIRAVNGRNARGGSDASNAVTGHSFGPPAAPTVNVKASSNDASVHWKAPSGGNGRKITGYKTTVYVDGKVRDTFTAATGDRTYQNIGWRVRVRAVTVVTVEGGATSKGEDQATTPQKPANPTVTLVHGAHSSRCTGSSCWLLGFRYTGLPQGRYRVCFHFPESKERGGNMCYRPKTAAYYDSNLSGGGKWIVTQVPDGEAFLGYNWQGWVVITNLGTGKSYTSPKVMWYSAGD